MTGRIIIIKISSLLYALACFFPTIYSGETHLSDWDQSYYGWMCLLFGWVELFLVQGFSKIFYLSWFANLTYGVALYMYITGKKNCLCTLVITGIVLSLIPLFYKDMPFFEPILGYESTIKNFHLYVGYNLWIGSFATLLLGKFVLSAMHKKHFS